MFKSCLLLLLAVVALGQNDLDCEKDSLPNKLKTNKACKNLKLSCDTIKSSNCKNTLGTIVNSKCRKKLSNTERKTDISDYCGKCNSKCECADVGSNEVCETLKLIGVCNSDQVKEFCKATCDECEEESTTPETSCIDDSSIPADVCSALKKLELCDTDQAKKFCKKTCDKCEATNAEATSTTTTTPAPLEDALPTNYNCPWTCNQWAEKGYCEEEWKHYSIDCFVNPNSILIPGKIKENCKKSCSDDELNCLDEPVSNQFCSWNCADWASDGQCDNEWSNLNPDCQFSKNGKIKDACKKACNNCD